VLFSPFGFSKGRCCQLLLIDPYPHFHPETCALAFAYPLAQYSVTP
jgi:hypothetical protein